MCKRLFLIVGLLLLGLAHTPAASAQPFDVQRIARATVFIYQMQSGLARPVITCVSSGTLVSRDGLILTNAHSTVTNADCPGDTLVVALSIVPGEPPVMEYQAEVVQANPGLDLALLRITRDFDGRRIDPNALFLPFVEVADSSSVALDDTITIFGYSGLGDSPVAAATATIIGFTAEPSGGERSWFKVLVQPGSAAGEADPLRDLPGTMSGGGAYNRAGLLIGIPTTAPITGRTPGATCTAVQDSSGDGLINQSDACIALGGSINALRPSNFAQPLLRSASLGLMLTGQQQTAPFTGFSEPGFSRLFFAPSVTDGMPSTVLSRLPAGSTSLYLFFDYANMRPETVYELRVTLNGVVNPVFSLAPVRWSGGSSGLWYVGSSGQVWPNGTYEFTLFIDGEVAGTLPPITVGGTAEPTPAFSSLVFGIREGTTIYGNGYVLSTGNVVDGQFIYNNMQNGMRWTGIWYYNGQEVQRSPNNAEWTSEGPNGVQTTAIRVDSGLLPGRYRLALYLDDRLAATADFTVAGVRGEDGLPRAFSNVRFVVADTPEEALSARAVTSFTNPIQTLFALFDWDQIAPGSLWRMRWLVDNQIFYDQLVPWNGSDSGQNYMISLSAPGAVPDGTYTMELLINERPMARIQVGLGVGQLRIDPFARAEGVLLRGQVLDANSRLGIPGVTVMIISEEFSIEDFVWDEDQIYALSITDRRGRFQIDRPLAYEAPYSFLIAADGYLPIPADGVTVDAESPNPLDMTIYLTQDG